MVPVKASEFEGAPRMAWSEAGPAADRAMLKKIVDETMLPKWAARCSAECVADFNATIGKAAGVVAKK